MTEPAQKNGQSTVGEDGSFAAQSSTASFVQPAAAAGRTGLVVGAAFIGGLILGRLVKRRDKQL